MPNEGLPVKISIKGIPPVKSLAYSAQHKENRKRRDRLLKEAVRVAKDNRQEYVLYGKDVKLGIIYRRSQGNMDSTNIIGGIADVLEGVFYKDDSQIREVHYKEHLRKKRDDYEVTLDIASHE